MREIRRVGLLIDSAHAFSRGLLQGVIRYEREQRSWALSFSRQGRGEPPPDWLRGWRGDGILARIPDSATYRRLRRLHVPLVEIPFDRGFSAACLQGDNAAIARLAADHLLDRGFRHFGFCGTPRGSNTRFDERCDTFVRAVQSAGYECHLFDDPRSLRRSPRDEGALARWVARLPQPVGILAVHDEVGQHVLAACRRANLLVPDQVAVIGCDNDELVCNLSDPPLTSIDVGHDRIGYEAAALLDRLMAGAAPPPQPLVLPPVGIITRQSTDVYAMQDRELATALRLIRKQAESGLTVEDVLRAVPLSQSDLERRMKRVIGRTPKAEILRVRLERVKELLADTNLTLAAIAARVGYRQPHHLAELFRSKFGQTPGTYRRKAQAGRG